MAPHWPRRWFARTENAHPRIAAIGEVDELNCVVGLLLTRRSRTSFASLWLTSSDLFDLWRRAVDSGLHAMARAHAARLEALSESLNAELPMLKDFILPGGSRAAAYAHLVRIGVPPRWRAVLVAGGERDGF